MFFLRFAAAAVSTVALTVLSCVWLFPQQSTLPPLTVPDIPANEEEDDRQFDFTPDISMLIAEADRDGSTPPVIKSLTTALFNRKEGVRLAAAWALGKIGAKSLTALPSLKAACQDPDAAVRDMAERAHNRIYKLVLNEAIDEETKTFWALAPKSNWRLHRNSVAEPVSTLVALQDADAGVKALIAALKDSDSSVRQSAVQSLGKLGEKAKEAIPALIEALKDKDVDVRASAAMALGRMGKSAKAAIPGLTSLLADPVRNVRCAAALILSRMGKDASEAVPGLVKMAKNEDKFVQNYACCALAVLDEKSEPHIRVLIDNLGDPKAEVRGSAAYVLGELGPQYSKGAISALAKSLTDQDKEVRKAVASALTEMGAEAKTVIPALTDALKDTEPGVRAGIALALAEVGADAKDAVPALIECLKDKEIEVRGSAVYALGEIGPAASAAITPLSMIVIQDPDAEVRRAAALAIGKIQE